MLLPVVVMSPPEIWESFFHSHLHNNQSVLICTSYTLKLYGKTRFKNSKNNCSIEKHSRSHKNKNCSQELSTLFPALVIVCDQRHKSNILIKWILWHSILDLEKKKKDSFEVKCFFFSFSPWVFQSNSSFQNTREYMNLTHRVHRKKIRKGISSVNN